MAHSISLVDSTSASVGSRVSCPVVAPQFTETPAMSFIWEIAVPDSGTNLTFVAPCALKIIGVVAHKIGVSAAADTVQLLDGATPITAALSLTVADGTLVTATGIAHTVNVFAAGDILTVDPVKVANCACTLYVQCIAQ